MTIRLVPCPSCRVLIGLLAGLLFSIGGLVPELLQAQSADGNPVESLQKQFEADSTLPSSSAELVSVETRLARTPVPADAETQAAVVLNVKEGWHVNAHKPTYDYLIGTQLTWTAPPDWAVDGTRYPPPKRYDLQFADDAIDVYEGQAPIFVTVRPAASAQPGDRRLQGRLRVQACNDQTCLRPSTINVSLSVPVAAAGAQTQPTGDPIFDAAPSEPSGGVEVAFLRQHGLFLAGATLVLGTVLFLVVYARISRAGEEG